MRLKLLFSAILICSISIAQTTTELKDFINKNNVAIRTVQKNMVRENNTTYSTTFKEMIKNQISAVSIYKTNKETSAHFAMLVRNESLNFLKNHTKSSTDYFEITESEKIVLKSNSENNVKVLSSSELKAIEDLDILNTQSLNTLILTIQ